MNLLKTFGSLRFAIGLICGLALILIVSTMYESARGTPAVQRAFYQRGWFDLFLALVAVNIFCSTCTRYPFKKHHTGFVITHIGILLLLGGSLIARWLGVEGQITLLEGKQGNRLLQDGYQLEIRALDHALAPMALRPTRRSVTRAIPMGDSQIQLKVHRVVEGRVVDQWVEGESQDPPHHAMGVTLSSAALGVTDTVWLAQSDPRNPQGYAAQFGPARLELAGPADDSGHFIPVLRVYSRASGHLVTTPVVEGSVIPNLRADDLTIANLRYFPHAKIVDNRLVNAPEAPENPAVEFDIMDVHGHHEWHTQFARFPQLGSLHGGPGRNFFDLVVDLQAPPGLDSAVSQPTLLFYRSAQGQWQYRAVSIRGTQQEGLIEPGRRIATGWMDFSFEVVGILHRAKIEPRIERPKTQDPAPYSVEITLQSPAVALPPQWVTAARPAKFETSAGPLEVGIRPKSMVLPFAIRLKDFRKTDYPGTPNPSAFESDVAVTVPERAEVLHRTIQMNRPLDVSGWRIFQSSYIQDASAGEGSVFTVARNPGIPFIYMGALVIFSGVLLLFYVRPFSSLSNSQR